MSVTEVVIWILYVVPPLRLSSGVTLNVLSLLEAEGTADILMQVVKLSEDSRKLPEQVVLSVFVVIVLVDIVSLNVTATAVETETSIELSVGLTEESVGAVVSVELTIKEVIARVLLAFPSESVTIIVQSE